MSRRLKVIFAGLDDGGKTSIIKTLERKEYVVEELQPTKGIQHFNIEILNCTITEWDFGGQEEYRRQYLKKNENFFETDLFFYVIDMIDNEKFSKALEYYKQIIEIIQEGKIKPSIIILLHKCEKAKAIDDEKVKNLEESITKLSAGFNIEFFKTTIFEPPTLMNAFSQGINKISTKSNELSDQLKDLAQETFADSLLLIETNGFIIGEYFKNEASKKMIMNLYNYLIGSVIYMFKKLETDVKPERILIDWESKGYAFYDVIEIDGATFFYIKYTSNPRKVVQKFVLRSLLNSSKQIKEIIKSYFN